MAHKEEVISFKVDSSLAGQIKALPNRSEFIRNAILSALDQACPLCQGTGVLKPNQHKHWDEFLESHKVERCGDCEAIHIVCQQPN